MDDSKDPPCQLDPSPIYYYESYPNLSTGTSPIYYYESYPNLSTGTGTGTGTSADENKDQLCQSDPSPICYYESYPNVATSGTISSSTKKSSVQYGNNKSWEGIKPPPSSGQSKPVLSQSSSVTSETDQPRSSSAKAKPPAAESQSPSSYSTPSLELNFLGLPIRPGKKDCPYYMRNGSCKYGDNCKFNHPDPTVEGDSDSEWDGYQVPPERNVHSAPAYVMNNPVLETNVYTNHQPQMVAEEYPEQRGQSESSYLKTKDRKHKSKSKHHHPKNRFSKSPSCALNDKGLPLRPNSNICLHYSHNGTSKFGHACKFDHPSNPAAT